MATDIDHCEAYSNHLRHPSSFNSNPKFQIQDISISELIDHGSVSFGKFSAEPLEWEKRSVFSHNRIQEEMEKLKAPGIVAQKKAYFEEYYGKIRALKKLQSEEQEVSQTNICEDKLPFTSQVQNRAEMSKSTDINDSDDTSQIKTPIDKMIACQDLPAESNKGKSLETGKWEENKNNDIIKRVQRNIPLAAAERDCLEKTTVVPLSSAKRCSKSSVPNTLVSVTVNLNANKLKTHIRHSEFKGQPVPSAKGKTKLITRMKRDVTQLPEKGKALSGYDGSSNASRRSAVNEKASHLSERNVNGKMSCQTSPNKFESSTIISRPQLSKYVPATFSSTKHNLARADLSFGVKGKSSSSHIKVTGKVNNVAGKSPSAGIAGKALESSSRCMAQKNGQSVNQKPRTISINRETETNQIIGVGSQIKMANKAISPKVGKKGIMPCPVDMFPHMLKGTSCRAGDERRVKSVGEREGYKMCEIADC